MKKVVVGYMMLSRNSFSADCWTILARTCFQRCSLEVEVSKQTLAWLPVWCFEQAVWSFGWRGLVFVELQQPSCCHFPTLLDMMQRSSWIMILNHHHLESRSWVMIVDHQLESSSWIVTNIESSSWVVILSHYLESSSWTTALNHHLETHSWIMIMIMICVFFDPANLYILLFICLCVSFLGYSCDNSLIFFVIFHFTRFY